MVQSMDDDVLSITYDWITRVLYFAMRSENQTLNILSLPLDNPMLESVYTGDTILSNNSDVIMTVAPFIGYANSLYIPTLAIVLYSIDNCTG